MKSRSAFFVAALLILTSWRVRCEEDELGPLIEEEQQEVREWIDQAGDLPPAFILGNVTGARVWSLGVEESATASLCSHPRIEELSEKQSPSSQNGFLPLNIFDPGVRETLGESCLIRPGDPLMAIGPGWQQEVHVDKFLVERDASTCPDNSRRLWVSFEEPLPGDPFFYSSDVDLSTGSNDYHPVETVARAVSKEIRQRLATHVKFLDEYDVRASSISAKNVGDIYILRRRSVGPEDDGLPNEMVLYSVHDQLKTLAVEPVDLKKGSGHLTVEGVLDYNHDSNVDVVISGYHHKCFYRSLYNGTDDGLEEIVLPNEPCDC